MAEITPQSTRDAWASTFASEWMILAEGCGSYEDLYRQGLALHRVVGDQPAEKVAATHFKNCPEPEQLVRDPLGTFTTLAMYADIIMRGDKLDAKLQDFAFEVVDLCASTADEFGHPQKGNAGDRIRALYGRLPRRP
ncbi:hypothetical protein SAMN05518800_3252 [Variovorax sp. YR752]|uniref:hypothetical protein n=1 Tax=Variovorax sp. YR752 TaxID=1884383 RepID=UPI000BCEAD29|nr:hypothetical protein [Variovorax sp. YR752]SOD27687.1 hypothetical protein SAMN05518800_3252 [Variovorax sp. YR752]